ncbi:uncharacterized membrane protein [Bacillus oleivorans]|uniref:Uncharacterized membrane protein n=1 Tax=Bacillus oleivorans TaxID=1448271 RepID=A0A285CSW6_9BACI|nr:DUF2254 domain-containing protein [Bacillus oleivorans]SNX70515.1 uncharacterized membrane protein [Bacillus oleivorans]
MNFKNLWFKLRGSYWFHPAVYSLVSIVMVAITTYFDYTFIQLVEEIIPEVLLTNHDIAKSLYSALITAILTMTTISFSSIMVVLTTTSSQFSPRILQDFMADNVTKHVLGIFSFGFVFSLINLLLLTENKHRLLLNPVLTVIFAIICLAAFILFIHHSTRWVQVNYLIGNIRNETSKVIQQHFSKKRMPSNYEWYESELEFLSSEHAKSIVTDTSGYVQQLQFDLLVNWAKEHQLVLKAHFRIGDYIQKGMPLFSYWSQGQENAFDANGYKDFLLIGLERSGIYDIEFSLQKLVEIALRAISPAINDPHTAANSINRIGSLLAEIGEHYYPMKYFADEENKLRLIMDPKPYREYLYKSFYQIKHYGKNDLSVMDSILEALTKTAIVSPGEIKEEIWEFSKYIMSAIDRSKLDQIDTDHIYRTAERLAAACGEKLKW